MFTVKRSPDNPILLPDTNEPWQEKAVFNWCPVVDGAKTHYVYRAMSSVETYLGSTLNISSIGYAMSRNGKTFSDRRQLIFPEYEWERYGCEDPRVTKIGDTFYIFYTALGGYPFNATNIKIAVATTKDFKTIEIKRLVTPFNAKAMALFPETINGKYVAVLSVDTDNPPAKLAFAEFDTLDDMYDEKRWLDWYRTIDSHTIDPRRAKEDQIEVGAPPVKTKDGWLLIYSHIENYIRANNPFQESFGVQALLLDAADYMKIIGRTAGPLLTPVEAYEKMGQVPDVVFPSGALIKKNMLEIYYGGADTVSCMASIHLKNLLVSMEPGALDTYVTRYDKNPILTARSGHAWEAHGVFNPGTLHIGKTTHIIYRAMSSDDTSTFGYAATTDGYTLKDRSDAPVYVPRESFEMKTHPGNSGCEDPRLTLIGKTVYMCYTAYDGTHVPRVALTSIALADFLAKRWNWTKPVIASPENMDDKDACVFPAKVKGQYLLLHRINSDICADFVVNLDFPGGPLRSATPIMLPRRGTWDSDKVGITAPPIKTKKGWLLLYHGVSSNHHTYRVGLALLDLKNPTRVISRTAQPVFEPEMDYEKVGEHPNVVFPCGTAVRGDTLFIYYGGADKVVGVATVSLKKLLNSLL